MSIVHVFICRTKLFTLPMHWISLGTIFSFHSTFFKWLIKWYNYLFMLRSRFTWHIRRVISKMQYSWWDSKTRIEDPSQRWDPAYKIWDPKCGTQELRWGTNPRGGTWSPRPWNCNWGHKTWDIRHAWDLRP